MDQKNGSIWYFDEIIFLSNKNSKTMCANKKLIKSILINYS